MKIERIDTGWEKRRGGIVRLAAALVLGLGLLAPVAAAPQSAAGFYEDALSRYEKNDVAGAIVQLKNALQQDQKMLAAHVLLGKALLRSGDLKGAEAAFEEAQKQGVNAGEIALPLGQVYLALGRPDTVIERIGANGLPRALQVEVLTMRANAYYEAGNGRLAEQSLGEARALDAQSATPLIAEVPMLIAAGRLDRARERADQAVALAPASAAAWAAKAAELHAALVAAAALAAYDKALSLDARLVDARVARAGLLVDLKREADAARDLDFLREAAPDDPRAAYLRALLAAQRGDGAAVAAALGEVTQVIDTLPPSWLARREQLLMAGALAHQGLGNQQKAREYLEILVARNARNSGARKLLASIYLDTRDYVRAQSLLETLQKEVPDDPMVMAMLGSLNMAQHRYLQASELLEKAAARTGSAEVTRSLAFSQFGLGRPELAQANLEKAFALDPGDARAGMALAMLYVRQGKAQKAQEIAEAMARRDPANLSLLNFLGSVKGARGDKAGARAAYEQVLARDAEFRPAALNLVRLDIDEKQFEPARKRLDAMLAKRHDDIDALFEYGMLEQRAGRPAEALRRLQKATDLPGRDVRAGLALVDLQLRLRQPDQALDSVKSLAAKVPDNLAVQLALARAHLARGDAANASSVLTRATRLANYDVALLVDIARLQLAAGNADGAAYSAEKALQGRPDDLAALALMVEIETRRGDAAKADAALKALGARYPNRVETVLTGAHLAMARGQYAAAVSAFRKALSLEENTANVLALARAHLAAGEAAKAAGVLDGWLQKHPGDAAAQKALAEAQFRAGQLTAARQSYAKALAGAPDDAALLNNYANLLLQLRDPAALEMAQKALKLAPGNALYSDTLGWVLVQQGQVEAGLRYLRDARLRRPESAEIRVHLAYALAKVGRQGEARDELAAINNGAVSGADRETLIALKKELGG